MIVLNLTLIGLAITLEPIPFTAFALVLASKKGVIKAAAFIIGWILSLAVVIVPKDPPKWQAGVDKMSPLFALVLGILVQPWGLVAAGVAVIVDAKLDSWLSALSMLYFLLLSAGTYLAVEIYAWVRPERTQELLTSVRAWVADHTDQVIMLIALVLGAWLVLDSIYLLAT